MNQQNQSSDGAVTIVAKPQRGDLTTLPEDRRGPLSAPIVRQLQSVVQLGDLWRFDTGVMLPEVYQYAIPGRRYQDEEGNWHTEMSVSPTGSGYDHLNRVAGVQLVQPPEVGDSEGQMVPNPIHRGDYIYLRLIGISRNALGQLMSYREDIEVDFMRTYEDLRLNATWYDPDRWRNDDTGQVTEDKPSPQRGWTKLRGDKHSAAESLVLAKDENGQIRKDEDGTPLYALDLPNEAELRALQTLSQLRRYGLRYAFTVAKNRILKQALGISRLPLKTKQPIMLSVVGWRDLLSPEERERQAREAAPAVWGAPIQRGEAPTLTDDEMAVVGEEVEAGESIAEQNGPTAEEIAEIKRREYEEAGEPVPQDLGLTK